MSAPIPPDELSVRSPDDILAMSFSDSDLYLEDGLFAKGQFGAVIGPAGVGKSRIVTQIACSFILGTPFMGMEVGASDKNCLFLQQENSNRRLKDQLSKQIATYTDAQRKRINARLHIKTVENDRDANLRMNTSANIDAIARLMNQIKPDVIFVDPLNAFAKGSLTSADGMLATLLGLQALARNANPARHSLSFTTRWPMPRHFAMPLVQTVEAMVEIQKLCMAVLVGPSILLQVIHRTPGRSCSRAVRTRTGVNSIRSGRC